MIPPARIQAAHSIYAREMRRKQKYLAKYFAHCLTNHSEARLRECYFSFFEDSCWRRFSTSGLSTPCESRS